MLRTTLPSRVISSIFTRGVATTSDGVVVLSYNDLVADIDLSESIERAYNLDGIGLLVVADVPGFVDARASLLPLASKLASLPADKREKLESPETNYSVGWSHGKEMIEEGRPDLYKGSFYANPIFDVPTTDPKLIEKYPEAALPNIWPKDDLPELEPALKTLGQMIVDVGALVAHQCDVFTRKKIPTAPVDKFEQVVRQSNSIKARLLHYYPVNEDIGASKDSWCTWHNDHGSLTGLCSAMFMESGEFDAAREIDTPDEESGLWARNRKGEEIRVKIPRDHIAFQIGETSQITSGGFLRATPHAVAPIRYPHSKNVCRNTFAVFMQPKFTECIDAPDDIPVEQCDIDRYRKGMTFGEFHTATINQYYGKKD